MKTLSAFLILMLGTTFSVAAQEILFSRPIKTQPKATCEVLGKVGQNFIVREHAALPYNKDILRFFDQQMQQIGSKKMERLPQQGDGPMFLMYDSFFVKVYVENSGSNLFLMADVMDEFAIQQGATIMLDSMRSAAEALTAKWDMALSLDKSKLLVNKLNYDNDSASFSTRIFDGRLKKLQDADFKISVLTGQEFIGQFLISNQADIYFPIHSQNGDVHKFEILSKSFNEEYFRSLLIDLKSKYLDISTLTFTIREGQGNKSLFVNAVYYDKVNSSIGKGFFSARVNTETNQSAAVFNPLKDSLLFMNKVNLPSYPITQINLNKVFILGNGGLMLIGEIKRARNTLTTEALNGNSQIIVDPRRIYDPTYVDAQNGYWQPEPMYLNPEKYRPISKVELLNKDILVCYLDSNLQMQSYNLVERRRKDVKSGTDHYLSAGFVNTSTGIHLLFQEMQRNGVIVRNNLFSSTGEMMRLPPLKTIYDTYKLIPGYGKQTGLRQMIIPGVFRDKIVFGKIDL